MNRRQLHLALLGFSGLALGPNAPAQPADPAAWAETLKRAKGQTVFWNAWGGDERTNAFIAWAGDALRRRHGIVVRHVKLQDTAEAVTRVVAEKTAGRTKDGSVDLIWLNGPNFLAMKSQGLLLGPVTPRLPNARFIDTERKRSNLIDFTVPVDGLAVPWRLAQFVFVYDSARHAAADMPASAPALLAFARRYPGRVTHPTARNYLGATFLKQALLDLLPDPAVLQAAATDATYGPTTAPLWTWYDALRPLLWRSGREFPESGPAQRQLLNDGAVDLHMAFDPAEAAVAIGQQLLPPTARVYGFAKGMLGNTSFVAVPFNAAHAEAAMVVADFLLEPATQARGQDPAWGGNLTVLDLAKLPPADRVQFQPRAGSVGMPTDAELGTPQLEPHPSWMTRLGADWERRHSR